MEYASAGEQGWPAWTTEDAAAGKAALKFTRPKNRLTEWRAPYREMARDSLTAISPPVRLRQAGRYLLTWKNRGTATHAQLVITDGHGVVRRVPLAPVSVWQKARYECELPAGLTTLGWEFKEGGADDQVLWLDEVHLAAADTE